MVPPGSNNVRRREVGARANRVNSGRMGVPHSDSVVVMADGMGVTVAMVVVSKVTGPNQRHRSSRRLLCRRMRR